MLVGSASSTQNYYTQAAAAAPVGVAAALAAIKANSRTKVTISDSSENIERNLEALRKVANNIAGVSQSDPDTAIQVTASQWAKLGTLLGRFSTNYQLQISDVTASNAAATAGNSHVDSFTVTDSSANIGAQMGNLLGKDKLISINVTTPGTLIGVTAAQLTSQASVIAKLNGNYGLAVSQATADD